MKKEHIFTVLIFSCRTETSEKTINLLGLASSLACNRLSPLKLWKRAGWHPPQAALVRQKAKSYFPPGMSCSFPDASLNKKLAYRKHNARGNSLTELNQQSSCQLPVSNIDILLFFADKHTEICQDIFCYLLLIKDKNPAFYVTETEPDYLS